jgi:hypothetical protein
MRLRPADEVEDQNDEQDDDKKSDQSISGSGNRQHKGSSFDFGEQLSLSFLGEQVYLSLWKR